MYEEWDEGGITNAPEIVAPSTINIAHGDSAQRMNLGARRKLSELDLLARGAFEQGGRCRMSTSLPSYNLTWLSDPAAHGSVITRPWGSFESLMQGPGYQVKRITVNPGGILSLQSHRYRAEHWVVVSGRAEAIVGAERMVLSEDQSVHIPRGAVHRLSNPDVVPLQIIEVQVGTYMGEDDIVRFDDAYGRTTVSAATELPSSPAEPSISASDASGADPRGIFSR
jgi:mannose-6-phosphate isomerase-like protein (cupin superfamily)